VAVSHKHRVIPVADLKKMTPQQRAEVVQASIVTSLDDVSEEFGAEIRETALRLGEQRRARA
jgi:histone H3/H4